MVVDMVTATTTVMVVDIMVTMVVADIMVAMVMVIVIMTAAHRIRKKVL